MGVTDIGMRRLERDLATIARDIGIDEHVFTRMIAELYLKGFKDKEDGKTAMRDKMQKILDNIK